MHQAGFTLIELLVVISIIALLISILSPVSVTGGSTNGKIDVYGVAEQQATLIGIGMFLAGQSRLGVAEGKLCSFLQQHNADVRPAIPAARSSPWCRRTTINRRAGKQHPIEPDPCWEGGDGPLELFAFPLLCMFGTRRWPSRHQREQAEQFIRQTFVYVDRFPVSADNHKAALMKLRILTLLVQYEDQLAARKRWKCYLLRRRIQVHCTELFLLSHSE
jgi:prepilin-type N-terminal cleavage/methylation domain-containing protein